VKNDTTLPVLTDGSTDQRDQDWTASGEPRSVRDAYDAQDDKSGRRRGGQ
jgi:hypothetical protein